MSFGHRGRSVTWSRSKNILKGTRTGTRRSSPGEFWRPSRSSGRNLKWDGPAAWLEPGNSWCRARHTSFHTGSGASGWSCSPCSMDAGNGHEDSDLGISAQPCDSHRGMARFVVIDGVSFRQHPLMQDAGNENASRLTPEKHDVPALLHAAQARANAIAGATRGRVVGQPLATRFKVVDITQGLVFAPRTQGVGADIHQVGIGKAG